MQTFDSLESISNIIDKNVNEILLKNNPLLDGILEKWFSFTFSTLHLSDTENFNEITSNHTISVDIINFKNGSKILFNAIKKGLFQLSNHSISSASSISDSHEFEGLSNYLINFLNFLMKVNVCFETSIKLIIKNPSINSEEDFIRFQKNLHDSLSLIKESNALSQNFDFENILCDNNKSNIILINNYSNINILSIIHEDLELFLHDMKDLLKILFDQSN